MNRWLTYCTGAVLIAASSSILRAADDLRIDATQEAALLKAAGPEFQLKRTPHFLVVHDSDPAIVTSFVSRVEQTYNAIFRFCEINKVDAHRPPRRLEIVFLDKRAEFDAYAKTIHFPSQGAYGVYYEPINRSTFFNVSTAPEVLQIHADIAAARSSLDKLTESLRTIRGDAARIVLHYQDGRVATLTRAQAQQELNKSRDQLTALDAQRAAYAERINRTVVQHEVTHQVFFNAGVHSRGAGNPKWLVEGLACLFETPPDSSRTGSGVFAINQLRLHDFRIAVAGERSTDARLNAKDFIDAVQTRRFPQPRTLIGNSNVFDERGDRGAANYAMAWSLVHYLQRERPAQLAAYIQELSTRPAGTIPKPPQEVELFEKHFGPLDATFLNRWGGYILNLPVRSLF